MGPPSMGPLQGVQNWFKFRFSVSILAFRSTLEAELAFASRF